MGGGAIPKVYPLAQMMRVRQVDNGGKANRVANRLMPEKNKRTTKRTRNKDEDEERRNKRGRRREK